ncbi:cilia- and flagella-associated protein 90 [Amia ocellicauda]|uniref:cilia- and flagella-associated protein 90 n=1 Tax=Amia ocellicauda TaxID=2972642 RepID=UPI00346496EA
METMLKTTTAPLSSLSAFSHIPPRRTDPKELTYCNTAPKGREILTYDCLFRRDEGYNEKLHRDDREHAKSRGLDVHTEERSRPVPILSSSEYGRRFPLEIYKPGRQFVRVGIIRSEFCRKNGIQRSVEEGYGSVSPA